TRGRYSRSLRPARGDGPDAHRGTSRPGRAVPTKRTGCQGDESPPGGRPPRLVRSPAGGDAVNRGLWFPLTLLLTVWMGCSTPQSQSPPADPVVLRWTNATASSGLDFLHRTGAAGMKYLIETMGSGVCVLDYDRDGKPDLYLVQSAPLPGQHPDPLLHASLYRNLGNGTFSEVTQSAGVGNPAH